MRARNIKPGFFKNEVLGTASPYAQLLFAGLWMLADRDGRLEDRPLRIKGEIFPYRDGFVVDEFLTELASLEFITRYEVDGAKYIQIENFRKHQTPHKTEKLSDIPTKPLDNKISSTTTVNTEKITEPLPPDSLNPDSLNHEVNARVKTDFQKIYEAGSAAFPTLATANTSAIHQWLGAGCDPELDAIPEIQRHAKAGKPVKSWNYFTGGVMDGHSTRTTPPPLGNPKQQNKPPAFEASKPVSDEQRIKVALWKKERGMTINIDDERLLQRSAL